VNLASRVQAPKALGLMLEQKPHHNIFGQIEMCWDEDDHREYHNYCHSDFLILGKKNMT
jgi:hypothetical protein